jgi:hypothetical protein
MTKEEIMRMAEASGVEDSLLYEHWRCNLESMTRFAALVASAEREKHKWDIHSCSPTCNRYACVATREAVLAEREACAEICKKHADFYAGLEPSPIAQSAWAACVDNRDTIRARGQE